VPRSQSQTTLKALGRREIGAIQNIIHHPDVSYPHPHCAFQRLPADEQQHKIILDRMSVDERKEHLIRALDSFKPHLEIPFGGHAYQWMLSYLSRMFERQGTVHTSESARRLLPHSRPG
jgi:hypothetical protein